MATVTEETKSPKAGTPYSAEDKFWLAWEEDRKASVAKKAELIREKSNLGERFRRRTFNSFKPEYNQNAYDKALWYSDHYKDGERNSLLLVGNVGTGKTHLAAAISNKLMDNGVPVLFDTYSGHLNKLRAEFDSKDADKRDYLKQMQEIEMLVIDDIGKEKQTEWTSSIMFDVINYRYEHILPIIITSNLEYGALKQYLDDAIWSRLCEMCVGVQTTGIDRRLQ